MRTSSSAIYALRYLICNSWPNSNKAERCAPYAPRILHQRTCRVITQHLFHSNSPASPGILLLQSALMNPTALRPRMAFISKQGPRVECSRPPGGYTRVSSIRLEPRPSSARWRPAIKPRFRSYTSGRCLTCLPLLAACCAPGRDAEEVVCDVYAHAWQHASTFDTNRGSVMAWLTVMARNRAVDRLRQRRELISLDAECNEAIAAR